MVDGQLYNFFYLVFSGFKYAGPFQIPIQTPMRNDCNCFEHMVRIIAFKGFGCREVHVRRRVMQTKAGLFPNPLKFVSRIQENI